MTYNDAVILRNHLDGILKIAGTAIQASGISNSGASRGDTDAIFNDAKEMWLKIYPESPVKGVLT